LAIFNIFELSPHCFNNQSHCEIQSQILLLSIYDFTLCKKKLFIFVSVTLPDRYADLIGKAQERHANLEESMKKNAMLREAKEIESWMLDCEPVVTSTEIGEDMDGIEMQQKEYDEFKKDMAVQENRIQELQALCLQLQQEKSNEHEKVQEILTVR